MILINNMYKYLIIFQVYKMIDLDQYDAIKEIFQEDPGLRQELFTLVSALIKYSVPYDEDEFEKSLAEFKLFVEMLIEFANLPKLERRFHSSSTLK